MSEYLNQRGVRGGGLEKGINTVQGCKELDSSFWIHGTLAPVLKNPTLNLFCLKNETRKNATRQRSNETSNIPGYFLIDGPSHFVNADTVP